MFGKKSNPALQNMSTLESKNPNIFNKSNYISPPEPVTTRNGNSLSISALEEGNLWFENGQYKKALELYSKALISCVQSDVTTFLIIYGKKSDALLALGEYSAVVDDCSFILKLAPDDLSALNKRMTAFEKLGQIMECINDKKLIREITLAKSASSRLPPQISASSSDSPTSLSSNKSTTPLNPAKHVDSSDTITMRFSEDVSDRSRLRSDTDDLLGSPPKPTYPAAVPLSKQPPLRRVHSMSDDENDHESVVRVVRASNRSASPAHSLVAENNLSHNSPTSPVALDSALHGTPKREFSKPKLVDTISSNSMGEPADPVESIPAGVRNAAALQNNPLNKPKVNPLFNARKPGLTPNRTPNTASIVSSPLKRTPSKQKMSLSPTNSNNNLNSGGNSPPKSTQPLSPGLVRKDSGLILKSAASWIMPKDETVVDEIVLPSVLAERKNASLGQPPTQPAYETPTRPALAQQLSENQSVQLMDPRGTASSTTSPAGSQNSPMSPMFSKQQSASVHYDDVYENGQSHLLPEEQLNTPGRQSLTTIQEQGTVSSDSSVDLESSKAISQAAEKSMSSVPSLPLATNAVDMKNILMGRRPQKPQNLQTNFSESNPSASPRLEAVNGRPPLLPHHSAQNDVADADGSGGKVGAYNVSAAADISTNKNIRDKVMAAKARSPKSPLVPQMAPVRLQDESEANFDRRKEIHRMNTVSFRNIYDTPDDELPLMAAPEEYLDHLVQSSPKAMEMFADAAKTVTSPDERAPLPKQIVEMTRSPSTNTSASSNSTPATEVSGGTSIATATKRPGIQRQATGIPAVRSMSSDLVDSDDEEEEEDVTTSAGNKMKSLKIKNSFFVAKAPHHSEHHDEDEDLGEFDLVQDAEEKTESPTHAKNEANKASKAVPEKKDGKAFSYYSTAFVNQPNTKMSIARGILYTTLKKGLVVIKHGRQGAPKRRVLTCDENVQHIFWREDTGLAIDPKYQVSLADSKGIALSDVKAIRPGTEIDPTTVPSNEELLGTKKRGVMSKLFGGGGKDKEFLYGTATLRRSCKFNELSLCLSLILNDRTFDIQCLNQKDYNLLQINLTILVHGAEEDTQHLTPHGMSMLQINTNSSPTHSNGTPGSVKSCIKTGSGSKKSVRFSFGDMEVESSDSSMNSPREDPEELSQDENKTEDPSLTLRSEGIAALGVSPVNIPPSTEIPAHVLRTTDSSADLGSGETVYELGDNDNYDMLLMPLADYSSPVLDTMHPSAQVDVNIGKNMNYKAYNQYNKYVAAKEESSDNELDANVPNGQMRLNVSGRPDVFSEETKLNTRTNSFTGSPGSSTPPSTCSSPGDGGGIYRMSSSEALQIGLLLSQQETQFGTNMYDSLKSTDEPELARLTMELKMTTEEALLEIFQRKFNPKHAGLIAMQNRNSNLSSNASLPSADGNARPQVVPVRIASSEALERKPSFHRTPSSEFAAQPATPDRYPDRQPTSNQYERSPERNGQYAVPTATATPLHLAEPPGAYSMSNRFTGQMVPMQHSPHGAPQQRAPLKRMTSFDALQIGLLLSQQESEYGTNMYDSLSAADEPEIRNLMQQGFSEDDALHEVFKRKFVYNHNFVRGQQPNLPPPPLQQQNSFDYNRGPPPSQGYNNYPPPPNQPYYPPPPQPAPQQINPADQASGMRNPRNTISGAMQRMNSSDGLALMCVISEQEDRHGTNMYDSLLPSDEPEIMNIVQTLGYTHEQAVRCLFDRRYPDSRSLNSRNNAGGGGGGSSGGSVIGGGGSVASAAQQYPPPPLTGNPYEQNDDDHAKGPDIPFPPLQTAPQHRPSYPPLHPGVYDTPSFPPPNYQQQQQQRSYNSPPVQQQYYNSPPPPQYNYNIAPLQPQPPYYANNYNNYPPPPPQYYDPYYGPPPMGYPGPPQYPMDMGAQYAAPAVSRMQSTGSNDSYYGELINTQRTPTQPLPRPGLTKAPSTRNIGDSGSVSSAGSRPALNRTKSHRSAASGGVPAELLLQQELGSVAPPSSNSSTNGMPGMARKKSIFSLNRKLGAVGESDAQSGMAKSIRYKEKDVKAITVFGYTKDQAVTALIQCNNNVNEAIQLLASSC